MFISALSSFEDNLIFNSLVIQVLPTVVFYTYLID